MFHEIIGLVVVAALWGITNPLIKHNTCDINKVQSDSRIGQFFLELKYLFTNYKYILPMGLNQLGSVGYFFILQNIDISITVPVTNSLTFVFTALMGWFLNESYPSKGVIYGSCLILLGSVLLCYDKYWLQIK